MPRLLHVGSLVSSRSQEKSVFPPRVQLHLCMPFLLKPFLSDSWLGITEVQVGGFAPTLPSHPHKG